MCLALSESMFRLNGFYKETKREYRFLSVWLHLDAIFRASVFYLFLLTPIKIVESFYRIILLQIFLRPKIVVRKIAAFEVIVTFQVLVFLITNLSLHFDVHSLIRFARGKTSSQRIRRPPRNLTIF